MKLQPKSGRSKVERQILLVFAWCALMPIGALAIVSAGSGALAPIAGLRVTLPMLILLCLCLVSLLSIRQIHSRLRPLEKLQQATQRFEERALDAPVTLQSGDEFEEVASSFNAMAQRLKGQINSMATMLDINRAILSAIDTKVIVDTILARIRELYPCDVVAVTLVNPSTPGALQTFIADESSVVRDVEEEAFLGRNEVQQIFANREQLVVDLAEGVPRHLEPLAAAQVKTALVLPLFVREELVGLVALGRRELEGPDVETVAYARQMADQAAIALSHAHTVEKNRSLAYYDSLTGLPNRRMFKDRLGQALLHARRRKRTVATCFLDLDGFKRINDTLGHTGGDRLLCQVAERLMGSVRLSDAVARPDSAELQAAISRLGGDEFTILLTEISDSHDAALVARRVLEAMAKKPFVVDDREVFASASIGIAVFPHDGQDADTLLRNADTAMHCAKARGRGSYQFYATSMNAEASRKLHLEARLRRALELSEFKLVYQPLRDAATGLTNGAEALLRWEDVDMGRIGPDEFIPIAEETGLIVPLGEWVLRTACNQCQKWRAAGYQPIRMAVNLSGHQLRQPDLAETVARILRKSGLGASQLELEITESTIMQDDDVTTEAFADLDAMGVGIALDDFGTGYSSLSYLRRFPIDRVKIDRSFVREVTSNPDDQALTAAIIAMAHGLRLRVVAEGVETREQADFLRGHGCDELQGYLFSRPVSAKEFERFLRKGKAR